MLKSARLFRTLSVSLLALGCAALALGCASPEPPAEEAPPAPPPSPPPPVYDITEVDITVEEPGFTSRNMSLLGFKLGDMTTTMGDNLGTVDNTVTLATEYLSDFRSGAIRVYTIRQTGVASQIEITTTFADEVASPPLRTWLEDGDLEQMHELMGGPEEATEENDSGGTEYVYDSRGLRFIQYPSGVNGIRFSQYRD